MSKYTVWLENNQGKLFASLNEHGFEPITILGDLFCKHDIAETCDKREENLLSLFSKSFHIEISENEKDDYVEKILALYQMISSGIISKATDIERLRSFFEITYKLDILKFSSNESPDKECWQCTPLLFGFSSLSDYLKTPLSSGYAYTYHCKKISDIPFAILHFLLQHDFKFRRCEHCEKWFATNSLKVKYCSRNSPYPGYEHLKCGEAVDHIMKKIKKRKHSILTYLSNYYTDAINLFMKEYQAAESILLLKSVSNLQYLEMLTSKEYLQKYWYIEKYKNKK